MLAVAREPETLASGKGFVESVRLNPMRRLQQPKKVG